jgi:hypothetical protein
LSSISEKAKATHSEQIEKLSAQIQSRDKQIKDSESKMSTIAHYVDQLEERLASFAIARKEISVREEKCKELEETDKQQREEIAALQNQVKDLAVEKDEMKSLIDLLVEERGVLQQNKGKLEKKVHKLGEESSSLKFRFDEKEEEIAKLSQELKESMLNLTAAEQTIEELEDAVVSVSNQLAEVERIMEVNRVEASEKLTIADELSSQQQQKIEELFARVAAAETPPPPPPLPGMVSDDPALNETVVLSDSKLSQPLAMDDAHVSDTPDIPVAEGSDTYCDYLDVGQCSLQDALFADADDVAADDDGRGGSEIQPLIEKVGYENKKSQHPNETAGVLPSTVSSESEIPVLMNGNDDPTEVASGSEHRGGNEDLILSEGVRMAEDILERFDDNGGDSRGVKEGASDSQEEGDAGLASTSTFEEESPPSLPTSAGQASLQDCPTSSPRSVPFRKLRKSLSKATGIHGVFTPPSRPRIVPPQKSEKASFGLKPKHPPAKKDLK